MRYLVRSEYLYNGRLPIKSWRLHEHKDTKWFGNSTWLLSAETLELARECYPGERWIVLGEVE